VEITILAKKGDGIFDAVKVVPSFKMKRVLGLGGPAKRK